MCTKIQASLTTVEVSSDMAAQQRATFPFPLQLLETMWLALTSGMQPDCPWPTHLKSGCAVSTSLPCYMHVEDSKVLENSKPTNWKENLDLESHLPIRMLILNYYVSEK